MEAIKSRNANAIYVSLIHTLLPHYQRLINNNCFMEYLKTIAREIPYIDIKPFSHNIINMTLAEIEVCFGGAVVALIVANSPLKDKGWGHILTAHMPLTDSLAIKNQHERALRGLHTFFTYWDTPDIDTIADEDGVITTYEPSAKEKGKTLIEYLPEYLEWHG